MNRSETQRAMEWTSPVYGDGAAAFMVHQYLSSDSTEAKLDTIEKIKGDVSVLNYVLAGDMLMDLAWNSQADPDRQILAFTEAAEAWEQATAHHGLSANWLNAWAGRAAVQLANIPHYRSLIFDGQITAADRWENSYQQVVGIANQQVESLTNRHSIMNRAGQTQDNTIRALVGQISETNVLLLLQRFGLNLGDSSWLAIPSLISQDRPGRGRFSHRSRVDQSFDRDCWDISVYTSAGSDEAPQLTYKVQVKTSPAAEVITTYDDDIIIVYAKTDLSLATTSRRGRKYRRELPHYVIPSECLDEVSSSGDSEFTETLNLRTDKLLEILG